MLEDPHLKVLHYEPDASKVFANTDIKGGVAVSYRDAESILGPIRAFYILGFDDQLKAETHNFVEADAAEASKNDTLGDLVSKYFG